ncbi:theronine dehydrogenase [Cylindrobasidium torrendii FP15055 ss-10]|uniref:Theronine dehydrogenase n=1 Tax=Cylindrobasidium torrendii FP15055 ss-10 TaxID=1314674 RepID=A0A0D7B595_9AGAR|nr:theronine dehydrogenase [Cylindrobasidium torrendii FP15055 ss-10]
MHYKDSRLNAKEWILSGRIIHPAYIKARRSVVSPNTFNMATSETMKAVVYTGGTEAFLEDRPKPTIVEPTDAIVRLTTAAICGTDLHILKGDVPTCKPGTVLGHEGVGIISSVGSAVKAFKTGDRVVVSCITSCLTCRFCRRGIPSHCLSGGWLLGNTIDGVQAEFARIPHADGSLFLAPDAEGITEKDLVMVSDVLPTSLECGVQNGRVEPGKTVAVIGAGPVGLGAVINAQLYSPRMVIVIDLDTNRLEKAKDFGATHTVQSGPGAVEEVMRLTGGDGVDVVIEAVGIPPTFALCQEIVAVGGNIANLGVHGKKVDLHLEKLWNRNITITTRNCDAVTSGMILKLIESGKLRAGNLVTHAYNMESVLDAYATFTAAAKTNALKVLLEF